MRSHPVRMALAAALGAMALLGAMACGSPKTLDLDLLTVAHPSWFERVDLVGIPIVIDDVVLSYASSGDDRLEIVAWEVETGDELWRDDVAIDGHRYDWLNVATAQFGADDVVTYLSDDAGDPRGWWQTLVVADPHTGHRLSIENPSVQATSAPRECDDGAGVCLNGWIENDLDGSSHSYRLDHGEGVLARDRLSAEVPSDTQFLAEHVFSTPGLSPQDPEKLGYIADGAISWQRNYEDVFGPGYSADGGWQWIDRPELSVIIGVGSPGSVEMHDIPIATYPVTESVTVALRRADGSTVWRVGASDPWCSAAKLPSKLINKTLPLCRYGSGTFTVDRTDPENISATVDGLDITLVGLDPLTGSELWSLALGGDSSLYPTGAVSYRSDVSARTISINGTLSIVNAVSGESKEAPKGSRAACELKREPFRASVRNDADVDELESFSAGYGVVPCDGDAHALDDGHFSVGGVKLAAIRGSDGWFIVAGPHSLAAYRITE